MRKIVFLTLFICVFGYAPANAQIKILPWYPKNRDIILFEDLDLEHQIIYRTFEGNPISHVGIVVIGRDGKAYIMHALGKHAGLTRSISPNKKEGVVFDPLIPYLKESMESTTDKNKVYVRVNLQPYETEEEKRFYGWVNRMAGRPYDNAGADRLLSKPIFPLPPYKEKPAVIEPKSTFCSGLVGSFCISGYLISPPTNRLDLQKMTPAEYSPWVNQNALTPADFWDDTGIMNLSKTYEKPVRIIFPKKNKK